MRSLFYKLFATTFLILSFSSWAHGQQTIRLSVDKYQENTTSETDSTWVMMEVKSDNITKYSAAKDQRGVWIIKAESENAAGGLIYKRRINPEKYPIIEWRWKVNGVLNDGNLRTKDGDDYPARIYITFDYDKSNLGFGDRIKYSAIKIFTSYDIPLRALNYIWANQAQQGTIAPNPFTDWVYMVAIQSGQSKTGQWITEGRNILKDYQEAFGENPPNITGIAIMTDSDNTGGSATAYYGDIIFRQSSPTE